MLIKTSSFPVNNQTEKIEIATFFFKLKYGTTGITSWHQGVFPIYVADFKNNLQKKMTKS